jgi:RNA polymerase sigma-70 factor (ECF subfamily)
VFRFIFYRVNDRGLAEDFTSETFLRALRRISTINYQGRDIGAWFMTIARNIVFDHTKSARFRLEMTTGDLIEGDDRVASTESAVLTHLTNERLMQALNTLGDEQKECLVLRFLHGLSVAETAEVMGKNDGAIKALQHRAVKRLAIMVGDELR